MTLARDWEEYSTGYHWEKYSPECRHGGGNVLDCIGPMAGKSPRQNTFHAEYTAGAGGLDAWEWLSRWQPCFFLDLELATVGLGTNAVRSFAPLYVKDNGVS